MAWLVLCAWITGATCHASTVDIDRITKSVKIESFVAEDADVFECAGLFQRAMARTLLPGDVVGENLLMSYGVAVCEERGELPKKSMRFETCTIEEAARKISELYSIGLQIDKSYILFSTQKITLPLVPKGRSFRDSELEGWWFLESLRIADFDIGKKEWRDYLLDSFKNNPSIGDVEIAGNLVPRANGIRRIGYWGKWRYAEFFSLHDQFMGSKIGFGRKTIITIN